MLLSRWSVTCLGLILNLTDPEVEYLRKKCGIERELNLNLRLDFQNQLESAFGVDNIFILSGNGSQSMVKLNMGFTFHM